MIPLCDCWRDEPKPEKRLIAPGLNLSDWAATVAMFGFAVWLGAEILAWLW